LGNASEDEDETDTDESCPDEDEDPVIKTRGPVMVEATQNELFPSGCPPNYDHNLPFHPTHQYVDRERCTLEHLHVLQSDLLSSQNLINLRVRQLVNLQRDERDMERTIVESVTQPSTRRQAQSKFLQNSRADGVKNCVRSIRRQIERTRLEIHRMRQERRNHLQVAYGIRLGINFAAENENTNFVIYINEDFPILQATQQHHPPAFPGPTRTLPPGSNSGSSDESPPPTKKPRTRRNNVLTNQLWNNDETVIFEIKTDLTNKNFTVVHVNSIKQFFEVNLDGKSKIIAFPFDHASPEFENLKNEIAHLYFVFYHTMVGWFGNGKRAKQIDTMHQAYLKFNSKLQNSDDNLEKKQNAIVNIRFYLTTNMNTSLTWYYYPDKSLLEMIQEFTIQTMKM